MGRYREVQGGIGRYRLGLRDPASERPVGHRAAHGEADEGEHDGEAAGRAHLAQVEAERLAAPVATPQLRIALHLLQLKLRREKGPMCK